MTFSARLRTFAHFSVATFAGFVSKVFAEAFDFAGAFFVALFAIFQHFLMVLVVERYGLFFAMCRKSHNISGKGGSSKSN